MSLWKRMFGGKSEKPGVPGGEPANPAVTASNKQGPATKDRVVRVFISSTFRDMIEDRNELMAQVWPALRRICRGRAVEFVDVDLRWGVTEEQSQRKETLRHCLAEIKRCRPYFIGLLGERYGWVPGPEAYSPALLDEEKWLADQVAEHSVTELEILHGVLNDPDMAGRSFFYFRDPEYAKARGGDFLPEDSDKLTRQNSLKSQVKAVCEDKHIPLREDYADPQALGKLVLEDLTAAIEAEFPPDQVPDVWAREDRDHEAYANSRRTEFYVGRDAYFERLDSYAREGADGCGLTVLGASGGGKSALLANWVARWRQANPHDFVFQHYIGSSPVSAGHLALMRRLMVAIIRFCRDDGAPRESELEEEKLPALADEIVKTFPGYLDRLTVRAKQKGVRAIVVLDALNQVEDRERGRLLAWLPYRLPIDLRLIVSTLPGDTLDALQPRGWPNLSVEPLTPKERVDLIARYLSHFSQGLSGTRAEKIANVAAASNPLYIKTLLDDLRATGAHDQLDVQIDDYVRAPDIPTLLGKILTRYERDYERDRPGLVGEALSLLWAARRGLTEPELLEVLSLPAGLWSPVRCALEDGLVDRDGILTFAHEHLRTAVDVKYVSSGDAAQALRLRLADHFAERPVDARQADELPWLLRHAESQDRLRACLLDIDRFLLIYKRDDELLEYWVWLKEERTMGPLYVQAFDAWAGATEESAISSAANDLSVFFFGTALYSEAESLMRRALELNEQRYGRNHPAVAISLNNLAQLLQATNRPAQAEPLIRRALQIDWHNFGETNPSHLTNLAHLLSATGRLSEAESLLHRSLEISQKTLGKDHPEIAITQSAIAGLLQETNRHAQGEPLLRQALRTLERTYGDHHPSVAVSLNNLAVLLQETNRHAEAEPLLLKALKISQRTLGEGHPTVAIRLNNLAQLYQATNRRAEAEPLMRQALELSRKSLGAHHFTIATRLGNLGSLLRKLGRFEEAEPLLVEALAIEEECHGKDHPAVATGLNNLAMLRGSTQRFAEAEHLSRRATEILLEFSRRHGHPHQGLRRAISNHVNLLQEMGHSKTESIGIVKGLAERFNVDLGRM